MGRNYYVFSSGRIRRRENSILIEYQDRDGKQQKRFIPVENVDQIFFLGEVDLNSKFLDFAAKTILFSIFSIIMDITPALFIQGKNFSQENFW